jgi:PIN domain nuclease of toxin-antitoxin system
VGRDEVILLDTHAAIWFALDSELLGEDSRGLADQALEDERLAVSSITFWEIALLISKRRLQLEKSPSELRLQLLDGGVTELPVTGPISILAVELKDLHGDPADRFIAATSVIHGATLMTADAELLRWPHVIQRQDASK